MEARLPQRASSLLDRARAGDGDALGLLLERSRGRLERLAGRRMGRHLHGRLNVSDVVQSTYVEALRGLGGFGGETEAAFACWLEVVLENKIRKRGRYYAAVKRDAGRGEPRAEATSETPVAALSRREELELVWRALDELEPGQRELILRRVEGSDARGLARELHTTPENARTLVFRARRALRARLVPPG